MRAKSGKQGKVQGSQGGFVDVSHQWGREVEVCIGMGKTGIPWVPWDSHGNGNKISHGMGMGIKCMGMGVKTWELSPATVNSLLFLHSNME